MREIKFRAWGIERGRMHDVHNIAFHESYGYKAITSELPLNIKSTFMKKEDFILMQYTGIKDKNNVEIYEGDVVKILVDNGFDYVDGFGVVRFRQGGFVIDHNNLDTEFEWLYYAQDEGDIEVIGNIYENSDLLEVSE